MKELTRLVSSTFPRPTAEKTNFCRLENGQNRRTPFYAVFETLPDEFTRVFQVGRYLDRVAVDAGRLRFAEKLCVFDSELIPNSMIYPI